jgi:hypothetical protein
MITPEKHLDLNRCVLRAGAEMLSFLKRERVSSFEKVRAKFVKVLGSDADVLFQPTINFLFLIGRIEYHPAADRFEYIEGIQSQIQDKGGVSE